MFYTLYSGGRQSRYVCLWICYSKTSKYKVFKDCQQNKISKLHAKEKSSFCALSSGISTWIPITIVWVIVLSIFLFVLFPPPVTWPWYVSFGRGSAQITSPNVNFTNKSCFSFATNFISPFSLFINNHTVLFWQISFDPLTSGFPIRIRERLPITVTPPTSVSITAQTYRNY